MDSKELEIVRRMFDRRLSEAACVTFPANVETVSEEARTCVVTSEYGRYEDVRLFAVEDAGQKGMCIYPAVGADVVVSRLAGSNELVVISTGTVSRVAAEIGEDTSVNIEDGKITARCGDMMVEVTREGIRFGGKAQGLKNTLASLCDAISKLTVTIPQGTSGTPVNAPTFSLIKQHLNDYLI